MEHPSRILALLGITPSRSLGQNFLADMNIARKIGELSLIRGDRVVEVGPGLGALTSIMAELEIEARAVEVDRRLSTYLNDIFEGSTVQVESGDFLKIEKERFSAWAGGVPGGLKILGNLPYSITGPIISKLIDNRESIGSSYIMLQKEVAKRLTSREGSRQYGALSVVLQAIGKVSYHFSVSRTSFFPVPEVDSAFISIDFLSPGLPVIKDFNLFRLLVNSAFSQRRKMVKNSLSTFFHSLGVDDFDKMEAFLVESGIEPGMRAENISLHSYVGLANIIASRKAFPGG